MHGGSGAIRDTTKAAGRNATITDVAQAAEVSIKTVSRVFNDEPNVRAETRERVRAAAAALDYHPNEAARSLAGRRTYLIALAYERLSPNYVADLQTGAAARLADERYRLMVLPFLSADEAPARLRTIARASSIDGVVLVPPLGDDAATLAELDASGVPYVRIAPTRGDGGVPEVAMDDRAAVFDLVEHLVGLGHRRIAMVRGPRGHSSAGLRIAAFREAQRLHDLDTDPALEERGDYGFESGLAAGRRLLALATPPTAVFAGNDDMAAGVLGAAHEAEVAVPGALSIVGFDDSPIARVVWPRLTTIHQPTADMAHAAVDALLAIIADRPSPSHIVLPHRLEVRGTTGPVAR